MTTFRLGINTCFAVKRWPEPAVWARIVRDELGLDLVQHSLDLVDLDPWEPPTFRERQAAEVRDACRAHGIAVHSTFTGLAAYSSNLLLHPDEEARRRALRWYRSVIDFTAEAGARSTGGHVGAFSVADFRDAERRRRLTAALHDELTDLSGYARQRGLDSLLVENLAVGREPATMADLRSLVRAGDEGHVPVLLCLDVGHQCVAGTTGAERDPYAWLAAFAPTLGMVQLQQSDAASDHHWPFTAARNAEGRIGAERLLRVLAASGRDEIVLVLEIIPPFEQDDDTVLAEIVESCTYWRQHIDAFSSGPNGPGPAPATRVRSAR